MMESKSLLLLVTSVATVAVLAIGASPPEPVSGTHDRQVVDESSHVPLQMHEPRDVAMLYEIGEDWTKGMQDFSVTRNVMSDVSVQSQVDFGLDEEELRKDKMKEQGRGLMRNSRDWAFEGKESGGWLSRELTRQERQERGGGRDRYDGETSSSRESSGATVYPGTYNPAAPSDDEDRPKRR